VTTQAGTFANCVLVRGTNRIDQTRSLVLEWTFAPEVGIVRFGSAMVEGGKSIPQVVTELKSYKLVKP
jgi:hypothetical protein